MQELDTLSWRRFMVLVRCLSQASATVTRLQKDNFIGGPRSAPGIPVASKDADRVFNATFGK